MAPLHIPNVFWIVISFIGFVMCAIPLPWHLEAWNTGTCLYMIWISLGCLNQFINATIWNGNAINSAPVWCDISTHFFLGLNVAIPCASLCINRRLYNIACVRSVTITKAEKRRAVLVDLAIGFGIPIIYMALQYIVQGHRFNIYEDVGCMPAIYNTTLAVAISLTPPVIIGCVSAVYSILAIRAFAKSRAQFKEFLSSNNNLNSSRYIRLMMLAGIETALTVPFGVFGIVENCRAGVYPWLGWADTHYNFSRVVQVPSLIWRSSPTLVLNLELTRFSVILCACIFFAFFGFAEEARKHYRLGVQSIAKRVGISTSGTFFSSAGSKSKGSLTSTSGKATIPAFVERKVIRKRDSMDSFTDVSASFSTSYDEKEKKDEDHSLVPAISYDDMKIADIGGTLADYNDSTISPTPSSGSSASSLSDVPRPDSSIIEISSVRSLDVAASSDVSLPEPSHHTSPPRHLSDTSAV
ncbi:hypothetical protein C0991_011256 [Blastosporella zonata]|nr:hypothetical protein C0991_011256 [Blastosporella zonata]